MRPELLDGNLQDEVKTQDAVMSAPKVAYEQLEDGVNSNDGHTESVPDSPSNDGEIHGEAAGSGETGESGESREQKTGESTPMKHVAADTDELGDELENTPFLPPTKDDLEGVDEADLPRHASLKSTIINVVNNMLGAGMLTLPWGMMNGSTIPTLILTFVVMGLCCYSMIIIGKACEQTNVYSFRDLWARAFGERYAVLIEITVGLTVCMTTVSYSVLIGDFLTEIFDELNAPAILQNRYFVVLMVTAFILAPLGILRDINMLRWTSVISVLAIFYAGSLAVARGIMNPINPTVEHLNFEIQFFTTQALINVAFTAHYNAPKYYREMKDRTQYPLAIFVSFFIAACLYSAVSIASYFEFGMDIDGNLLSSFDDGSAETLIAKALMAVVIIFTFPLPYYTLRTSFDKVFFGKRGYSRRRMILEGLLILPWPILVGILYPEVEIVIAYKGATFGTLVVYLYPALLFWRLCKPEKKLDRFGVIFLIVFGTVTGIIGVITTSAETFCFWGLGRSRC